MMYDVERQQDIESKKEKERETACGLLILVLSSILFLIFVPCIKSLLGGAPTEHARSHGGKAMRMFNQNILFTMTQESRKETTTFTLNAVETERLHRFVSEHKKHARHLVFGELVRVSFVPSTMGTHSEVQCLTCREVEDITDYEEWSI